MSYPLFESSLSEEFDFDFMDPTGPLSDPMSPLPHAKKEPSATNQESTPNLSEIARDVRKILKFGDAIKQLQKDVSGKARQDTVGDNRAGLAEKEAELLRSQIAALEKRVAETDKRLDEIEPLLRSTVSWNNLARPIIQSLITEQRQRQMQRGQMVRRMDG